ncbi:ABC transporter substrate-binding protein [Roseospirillum parvum]|uniref:Multiple sugar transport system substrate-binding protein n=1 Tax=Roseospirillum parvum TaxID=83401 RepID=A0A1G7WAJ8_9PROT|nr:extracellular solute-binding protein [Roseospirillum parvum]SDG68982.1 multiple sugar transport system substrate-binding protein [Roseospirillum parvum]
MSLPRRAFLSGAVGVGAALLTGGAGPLGRTNQPLSLWTTDLEPRRRITMRHLLDVQRALSGGPRVNIEVVPEEDLVDLLRLVRAGRSLLPRPDLINTGADALLALDAEGFLDAAATARVVVDVGALDFQPGALAALRRPDGSLLAVPFHGWPQVIWTRADWLADEHGLEPPRTIDELLTAARLLNDPARDRRGVILGTGGDYYTQQCFMMIARAFGAAVFTADGPSLDSPGMVEALRVYRELANHAGPGTLTWRARDYYLQGRAGMLFYSTFLMDDLAIPEVAADSLGGDHFDDLPGAPFDSTLVRHSAPVVALRQGGRVGAFNSINGLGLTARGDPARRRAARQVARFLFRRDAYITWLHMSPGGMLPVLGGIGGDDAFLRDRLGVLRTFGRDTTQRLADALKTPATFSIVSGHDPGRAYAEPRAGLIYAERVVGHMVARVVGGFRDPASAAAEAQREALRLLGR